MMPKGLLYLLLSLFLMSLFQMCCSSKPRNDAAVNEQMNDSYKQPFSRNMIEATISPNRVWRRNGLLFCKADIVRVHIIGGGIRPIAESTENEFEIYSELFEEIENSIGKNVRCRISEAKSTINDLSSVNYKILSIIKN